MQKSTHPGIPPNSAFYAQFLADRALSFGHISKTGVIENVGNGIAYIAHHQAQAATSPDVRAVWRDIASDETEHAQLSRDVATWIEARLSAEERAQVAAAYAGAILALRRELDTDVVAALVSELGLPSRQSAVAQFDALTKGLLARG